MSSPKQRHPLQQYESTSTATTNPPTTTPIINNESTKLSKLVRSSSFQSSPPGAAVPFSNTDCHSKSTNNANTMKRSKSDLMHQNICEEENNNDDNSSTNSIQPHLTLLDLLSLGVGGTVGSGMFVLCGLIARTDAGPATCLSWLISGVAACLSGLCYAEMSCAFPAQEGSSYVYAKETMGEWWGIIAAACLTLEYGMSGAAVARSWGDKASRWFRTDLKVGSYSLFLEEFLQSDWGANTFAFLVSAGTVALLANGVKESKNVTNVMTAIKLTLVVFMIVGGFFCFSGENVTPFIPPELGFAGVARGATSSFFGYLGYDEVCCVAGEAINPTKDVPRAVLYTLTILSLVYVVAAFVLTGMQPWQEISVESGFPEAFRYNGWNWAAQIAAAGEVITLPVVVLICLMAQPRLQYAVAKDGLLPKLFCEVDETGNLFKGTVVAGIVLVLIATFVPFQYIDDLISAGILVAFNITDSAVILVRYKKKFSSSLKEVDEDAESEEEHGFYQPEQKPKMSLERQLILFHSLSFGMAMMMVHGGGNEEGEGFGYYATLVCFGAGALYVVLQLAKINTSVEGNNGGCGITSEHSTEDCDESITKQQHNEQQQQYFQTPFVPYLPCLGAFVNWYLIAQLEISGLFMLLMYLGITTLFYFFYGIKHSKKRKRQEQLRRRRGFLPNGSSTVAEYESVGSSSDEENDGYGESLLRTISLPTTEYRATHMATTTTY